MSDNKNTKAADEAAAAAKKAAEDEAAAAAKSKGAVRGHYLGTRQTMYDPFEKIYYETTGDGVPSKRVGEVKEGSWLDCQLKAGTIKFFPES